MSALGRVLLLSVLALAGCDFGRHAIANPGTSQAIRVESGDRLFMDLTEDAADGGRWEGVSDDPDVDVLIERAPGVARVTLRVHRGYDGPTTVAFRYVSPGAPPVRRFVLTLYKRTGDCAFWE